MVNIVSAKWPLRSQNIVTKKPGRSSVLRSWRIVHCQLASWVAPRGRPTPLAFTGLLNGATAGQVCFIRMWD
jgi:hypothetical protein